MTTTDSTSQQGLRVVNLKAENFKRLKAIDITPEGDVVFVGGKNAQGKTSVLDAIWAALAGGDAARAIKKPIRDGEDRASVTVDLGEYVVTRKWTKDDAGTLTVTAPSGAKFGSPQKLLDDIIGARAFDPLAFTRLPAREQVASLLSLVDLDLDLDAVAAKRDALYEERTTVGRQGKALGETPTIDKDAPAEEESASEILAEIQEAQDAERHHANVSAREAEAARKAEDIESQIARLKTDLAAAHEWQKNIAAEVAALPAPVDVEPLRARLSTVEDTNRRVRENVHALDVAKQITSLRDGYDKLTAQIDALDKQRVDALAAAKFPVDGLSFGDEGVTLNGIPFSQASSAEQLKVSTALAIAANPSLRVLRILDGSLLDSDSLRIIADLATEHDYQVWIEVVDESGEIGFVIEDGEVRA